jgi:alpha-glucosidase
VYLYQGEELGLWEVEDIPPSLRRDPEYLRAGGRRPGRDGCRVPLPWAGDEPPYGFGSTAGTWLPQPEGWKDVTVEAESTDPDSMLALYRHALALRRAEPDLATEEISLRPATDGVVTFTRGAGFTCLINFGPTPVELPPHEAVLLASDPLADGHLPPDTATWLRT